MKKLLTISLAMGTDNNAEKISFIDASLKRFARPHKAIQINGALAQIKGIQFETGLIDQTDAVFNLINLYQQSGLFDSVTCNYTRF